MKKFNSLAPKNLFLFFFFSIFLLAPDASVLSLYMFSVLPIEGGLFASLFLLYLYVIEWPKMFRKNHINWQCRSAEFEFHSQFVMSERVNTQLCCSTYIYMFVCVFVYIINTVDFSFKYFVKYARENATLRTHSYLSLSLSRWPKKNMPNKWQ